jgi:hypothetical protein
MNADLGSAAVSGQHFHQRRRHSATSRTGILHDASGQSTTGRTVSGRIRFSSWRVAAIVDVGAALIVPFEVINEFGDEDVGPTYLCLRGGEPLHKRD